ncbi:MAG: RimK family protein [Oleiphilaceae bacterium]|nr:RimK family protein [Oleiphilaceae bacterium]
MKTLIVVDDTAMLNATALPGVISFSNYLHDYPKLNEPRTRVINLCDTQRYLSKGYYCSLLAEARQHRVLPSVKTINALRTSEQSDDGLRLLESALPEGMTIKQAQEYVLMFGRCQEPLLQGLVTRLFQRYPAPLLKLVIAPQQGQWCVSLRQLSLQELSESEREQFVEALKAHTESKWKQDRHDKRYRWEMAILVDPNEQVPPSNAGAISRFIKAAAKLGIHAQALSVQEMLDINHYDALFIRETTAIDHHTYRLARKAEEQGLVVLDDPNSILRCCNKVFLHDAFNYQKVPSLKTRVLNQNDDATLDQLEQEFGYPLVLKMPEGSFSKGVFKVKDRAELSDRLAELFKVSDLVLAQEYLFTDYDWRIGVLDGRAIYACRYYMARNHWQIYNHGSKRFFSGGFDCLPTFEVPKTVLDAALRAAKVVGDGLYGVDIKMRDNRAFVLEVNDNPSLDHKIEDAYLGQELYMQVMAEFLRRLENRGR